MLITSLQSKNSLQFSLRMSSTPVEPTNQRRSAPRSRKGCIVCKSRRVRCDERHPSCGNCDRLKFNCKYVPSGPRRRRVESAASPHGFHQRSGSQSSNSHIASCFHDENQQGRSLQVSTENQVSDNTGHSESIALSSRPRHRLPPLVKQSIIFLTVRLDKRLQVFLIHHWQQFRGFRVT
jgi:hypothetical protein